MTSVSKSKIVEYRERFGWLFWLGLWTNGGQHVGLLAGFGAYIFARPSGAMLFLTVAGATALATAIAIWTFLNWKRKAGHLRPTYWNDLSDYTKGRMVAYTAIGVSYPAEGRIKSDGTLETTTSAKRWP